MNKTSKDLKEYNELKYCTFKPKINENFIFRSIDKRNKNPFERLYSDYERIKNKQMATMIELEKKENKKSRITQSLCINRERSIKSISSSKDKFLLRQEHVIVLDNKVHKESRVKKE
jgi:hypothetical protein